jgi:hypothetical protein
VCLFIFTPEVTVGAFELSSTSSVLKKELLKIGKIQFAQYQLSDDVDKRWYSSIARLKTLEMSGDLIPKISWQHT